MPQLRKIIVLFKTHLDVGFTDLAANVGRPDAGAEGFEEFYANERFSE